MLNLINIYSVFSGSVSSAMVKAYRGFGEHGEGRKFRKKKKNIRFYKGKLSGVF